MLGKKLNKVYDPHLKTGLGYANPERLKKAIAAQPKIYDGEKLESTKLKVTLPGYEETLEDAEEIQLKMKDKMIQLDYAKINALYESFVPQTEIPVEQTYFSSLSTSNVSFESSSKKSDLPSKKMPNESKLLKLFVNLGNEINQLGTLINNSIQREEERTVKYDEQNEIRKYFTTEILENDFKRAKAQYINLDLKMQHQKEKNACDVSWVSQMAKLNCENVSLNIHMESLVQENERIKLEFQKLFNSIKTTRVQHQQEVNELIENVDQKTYAYGDVCAKNQDLLMIISELKATLKLAKKGKNVNTKFDKSATLKKLICVTPLNKNKVINAKIVSKVEIVDSGYSKHMTGNLKLLRNFVEKFMGITALEMTTSLQSLDMKIMFKGISRYVTCTTLRASDTIFSRSDNFVIEILK
ncbi:hypothetical protein Tco_1506137 [Tanacetum coccineum]